MSVPANIEDRALLGLFTLPATTVFFVLRNNSHVSKAARVSTGAARQIITPNSNPDNSDGTSIVVRRKSSERAAARQIITPDSNPENLDGMSIVARRKSSERV